MAGAVIGGGALFVVKSLAGGAVSSVGGKTIGKKILDNLPSELAKYFKTDYTEISTLIGQNLKDEDVRKVKAIIKGVTIWFSNVYQVRKNGGAPKEDLHRILEPQMTKLVIELIPLLMDQECSEVALGPFVIAASLLLAIVQELARVDPAVNNPCLSSYLQTFNAYATEYADHAEKSFQKIFDARISHITEISSTSIHFGHYRDIVVWEDKKTGEKFVFERESDKETYHIDIQETKEEEAERQKYIDGVKADLEEKTTRPQQAVSKWRQFLQNPLLITDERDGSPALIPSLEEFTHELEPAKEDDSNGSTQGSTKPKFSKKKRKQRIKNKVLRFSCFAIMWIHNRLYKKPVTVVMSQLSMERSTHF